MPLTPSTITQKAKLAIYNQMTTHGISIILCVRNGAVRILPTLKALSDQVIPQDLACELLILDNGSTDATVDVAKRCWDSLGSPFPLSIFSVPDAGKSNALVMGYDSAKYELMLVCDDDNWLQPEYLKTVSEVYSLHPDIGLLGGYGKAILEPEGTPDWFEKWEKIYVCGKHHSRNGFLERFDFRIWGAGSVLRKKMWYFLTSNNFEFYNGTNGRATVAEDVELSKAVVFTGHRLYFDERLWFHHDLRGGRISWQNLLEQQAKNGRGSSILHMYDIAYDIATQGVLLFDLFCVRKIYFLMILFLRSLLVKDNEPKRIFLSNTLYEILSSPLKYRALSRQSLIWIGKVSNTFPLFERDSVTLKLPRSAD
jgi:glycosyltransferase involved in cell wall biosynthesis